MALVPGKPDLLSDSPLIFLARISGLPDPAAPGCSSVPALPGRVWPGSRFGSTDYAILFPPRQPPTPSSAGCLEREHRREVTQSRTDRLIATGPSLELQRHLLQVTQRKQDSSPDNDTGTTPSWPWPLHPCLVVSWFLPKQQHRLALVH